MRVLPAEVRMALLLALLFGAQLAVSDGVPDSPAPPGLDARRACTTVLEPQHVRHGFPDVLALHDEVLIASGDGTVRTLAPSGDAPIRARLPGPVLALAAHEGGTEVAAGGLGFVARSRDGGRTFAAVPGLGGTFFALAYAGPVLVAADLEGRAFRIANGAAMSVALPGPVSVWGASFADSQHGYLSGECGALFATSDGARTFTRLRGPALGATSVLARGAVLYVSGGEAKNPGGVFRSDDGGRAFTRVVPGVVCSRMSARGASVAAACSGAEKPLWLSSGGAFEPIRVPQAANLLAAAFLPDGEVVAVGAWNLIARGRAVGGALVSRDLDTLYWKSLMRRVDAQRDAGP